MSILGIDLGGTQIRAGIVDEGQLRKVASIKTPAGERKEKVLEALYGVIDDFSEDSIGAIGVGVPSVVDIERGIVYDVQKIPSWKEIPLKDLLESRYGVPVSVNNDANCFVLGEKYFGEGKTFSNIVGLTLGTGLGGGIIIRDQLYSGANCGAGEFGMVAYLEHNYEYYASGSGFQNMFGVKGTEIFKEACNGNTDALKKFEEFGRHLGKAVKMVLYTYDPECIIFGGSIKEAYPLFKDALEEEVKTFAYGNSLKNIKFKVSTLEQIGVLGAAGLCYDQDRKNR